MPQVRIHINYVGDVTTTWGRKNPHVSDLNIANVIYSAFNIQIVQVGFLNINHPEDYYPKAELMKRNGAPAFVESCCKKFG